MVSMGYCGVNRTLMLRCDVLLCPCRLLSKSIARSKCVWIQIRVDMDMIATIDSPLFTCMYTAYNCFHTCLDTVIRSFRLHAFAVRIEDDEADNGTDQEKAFDAHTQLHPPTHIAHRHRIRTHLHRQTHTHTHTHTQTWF